MLGRPLPQNPEGSRFSKPLPTTQPQKTLVLFRISCRAILEAGMAITADHFTFWNYHLRLGSLSFYRGSASRFQHTREATTRTTLSPSDAPSSDRDDSSRHGAILHFPMQGCDLDRRHLERLRTAQGEACIILARLLERLGRCAPQDASSS